MLSTGKSCTDCLLKFDKSGGCRCIYDGIIACDVCAHAPLGCNECINHVHDYCQSHQGTTKMFTLLVVLQYFRFV